MTTRQHITGLRREVFDNKTIQNSRRSVMTIKNRRRRVYVNVTATQNSRRGVMTIQNRRRREYVNVTAIQNNKTRKRHAYFFSTEIYCAYRFVFLYSTLVRGIGGGFRSHKTYLNPAHFCACPKSGASGLC